MNGASRVDFVIKLEDTEGPFFRVESALCV
jgi:hypothetical protein